MLCSLDWPTRLHSYRSSVGFKTFVVSFAVFTDVLFYGLIIPFVPIMLRTRLHMTGKQVPLWSSILLAIYGGSTLVASPICGWLADRQSSRRGPLLVGFCCLSAATLLLQLGSTLPMLILGRISQGASAAIIYSAGLALLCDAVGRKNLGVAMGYITLSITAATFLGPTLGGILFATGGERAVFGFAYGVIALDIALRLAVIEEEPDNPPSFPALDPEARRQSDYGYGSFAESAPLMREQESHPPARTGTETDHTSNNKGRAPASLILLRNPRFLTALLGWLAVGAFMSSFDAVLPIFVRDQFGWSPMGVGLLFLPLFAPNLAGPLYGRLVDSSPQGPRSFSTLGFLINVAPLVLLRLVQRSVSLGPWLLCGLLFCIGLGLAVEGPALMVEVFASVSEVEGTTAGADTSADGNNERAGEGEAVTAQAYGLYNSALAMGQLLGPLAAGPLLSFFGWGLLTTAFGVFSGVCGLLMFLFLGRRPASERSSREYSSLEHSVE
ncbi:major facilitator superfamily domain-containing protein [Aspergillus egyptiacus]|nr:major facilitator superfamily domain-containing protein [Aspergillus egyptiacus]